MNSKSVIIGFIVILAVIVGIAGYRGMKFNKQPIEIFSDMVRQKKVHPQMMPKLPGGGELKPVAGTIPQGEIFIDEPIVTGLQSGSTNYVEIIPIDVDNKLLLRGRERYEVFCSHCHGLLGDANTVARRIGSMPAVASLYEKRIMRMTDGEIFNVISYGRNLMSGHSAQIPIKDRWAIVAYVRALQLTRLGAIDDAPEQARSSLLNFAQ